MSHFEEKFKKLYYKEGRRYKEYIKHIEIPSRQLYFLDGEEFVPYDTMTMDWFSYKGRPKNGVWKVYDSGCTWIGDYDITDTRIELEKYKELIVDAVNEGFAKCAGQYVSYNDIANEILNRLSEKIERKE
jgi:hypothetical protein